jgi:hypothetical protein
MDSGGSSSGKASMPAPTFSEIYSAYLASGTVGNCVSCHRAEMGSASSAYSWLSGIGQISGASSRLTGPGSCLTWYGGTMPFGGPRSDPQAVSAMNAWAAAGAMNN